MTRYLGQSVAEKIGLLAGLPPEEREVVANAGAASASWWFSYEPKMPAKLRR
ncbi:cyclic lactone autoinducer peptide [Candidatus Contubernalis alkaliaceticus]|uniref:cyclic lactone autoinducer peptide n=1 Tax=Candidatus Contubernalis alkaliaceticus TaxID=338645 RepID=UPI001F4BDE3D|nr:cyclic lactone autoinducer peptide [Candidatus Contubernalis alkalaceticus]UNC92251.1 cyclic lactone autoinducer peptide [Candidatus Contubernalis alkalaceticus]